MSHIDDLKLITVEELAEICHSGIDWIEKAVQARSIPFTRPARRTLFTRAQVAEIIAMHEFRPSSVPTTAEVDAKRDEAAKRSRSSA